MFWRLKDSDYRHSCAANAPSLTYHMCADPQRLWHYPAHSTEGRHPCCAASHVMVSPMLRSHPYAVAASLAELDVSKVLSGINTDDKEQQQKAQVFKGESWSAKATVVEHCVAPGQFKAQSWLLCPS
eukprot:1154444-Pelagomonas_calceolata.AAC.3